MRDIGLRSQKPLDMGNIPSITEQGLRTSGLEPGAGVYMTDIAGKSATPEQDLGPRAFDLYKEQQIAK
jgi:hypothetical protein